MSADLYLELVKRAVSNYLYLGGDREFDRYRALQWYEKFEWSLPEPCRPHTLLSWVQLDNLHARLHQVVRAGIPGDFVEAGVWRGGAVVFMRAFLEAHAIFDRTVWAADTFAGIPRGAIGPEEADAVDAWPDRWIARFHSVVANVHRYGLLDDRIRFLEGRFSDTLRDAPFDRLALVRLDADSYRSTLDALDALYPRVSAGGFIIIDDWHLPGCRRAVDEYREHHRISDALSGVFTRTAEGGESCAEAVWHVGQPQPAPLHRHRVGISELDRAPALAEKSDSLRFKQSADAVSRVVDGQAVILGGAHPEAYALNRVGTKLWALIESPQTMEELAAALVDGYRLDPATAQRDCAAFIADLKTRGLIDDTP